MKTPTGKTAPKRTPVPARTEATEPAADTSGRQRLMDAAIVEFSEKGFEGTSVLAIARRADVKQPLLNYHFGGKEGLWRAVVESTYTEAMASIDAMQVDEDTADALTKLRSALRVFAIINVLHPAAHSLVLREVAQAGPRLDWIIEHYMRPFHELLDALLAECQAEGLIKPYPRAYASVMMTSLLTSVQSSMHLIKRLYDVDPMSPEQAEQHTEQTIDLLLNGMLTDAPRKKSR
ncbi:MULTISPECIES: TetR/AcrR family transcriptional regulator [unclassified Variovorax]|uniref:TetR/AcrR family transcriptional regulator n=1 Tax=unclassified Variovorax TaxID=663243 RepID=UPI0032E547D1